MGEYLANRPEQIVDTAIRCLSKLSKDDSFTGSSMALGESAKVKEDPSFVEKIIMTLDKTSDAIVNHGKAAKDSAKSSTKQAKSWKGSPDTKVKVRDTKRLKTIGSNTKKEIRRAQAKGADKSTLDKIMETYREHRKAINIAASIAIVTIPALISGIISGYDDAINETVEDNNDYVKDLKRGVKNGSVDPKVAAAYASAYTSVSKDMMDDDTKQYSSGITAINEQRARGES